MNDVYRYIEERYATMIDEEKGNLDKITLNIKRYDKERKELQIIFGIYEPKDETFEEQMSLVDVEYKLRTEVKELRKKKEERVEAFDNVRKMEKKLCDSTGSTPRPISINGIATDLQMETIKKACPAYISAYLQIVNKQLQYFFKNVKKEAAVVFFQNKYIGTCLSLIHI